MSIGKDIVGTLIGVILLVGIVFGLFAVVAAPLEMLKMADAETWPSRKGVIKTSSVVREPGFWKRGPFWHADICGTYKDNGESFCISRVRYGDFRFRGDKAGSRETAAKYPVGREVDVYYSPDNPKETTLEPHASWQEMTVLLSLGIGFLFLPVLLWALRKKIEPERYGRM